MTMTDTNQPQPGTKLDEAIAKALGWTEIIPSWNASLSDYDYWKSPDGRKHSDPPAYSTNTATAMATLEQLCKPAEEGGRGWNGWSACYDRYSDGKRIHSFSIGDQDDNCEAPTLAHAIALAMLAALEAEE